MNETVLGKLTNVTFGLNDGRIGLFYTLSGASCSSSSNCCWDPEQVTVDNYTSWTEADRDKQLAEIMRKVSKLLAQAKVNDVSQLNGIPVEFTFENNMLSNWRILTEVL